MTRADQQRVQALHPDAPLDWGDPWVRRTAQLLLDVMRSNPCMRPPGTDWLPPDPWVPREHRCGTHDRRSCICGPSGPGPWPD